GAAAGVIPHPLADLLAGGPVPQADVARATQAAVRQAGGGEPFAVGGEGGPLRSVLERAQAVNLLARGRLPQTHGVIVPEGGEDLAVAGEGERVHRSRVPEARAPESGNGPLRQGVPVQVNPRLPRR